MINLYEVFDDEHKELLKKYGIEVRDISLNSNEYELFLSKTNRMSIADMEKIYDYLDDYFIEQELKESTK